MPKLERTGPRRLADEPATILWGLAVVAVVARFSLIAAGHTFDFESYRLVADIVGDRGNVYAETARYNYGPPWFLLLGLLASLADLTPWPVGFLRVEIVAILTLADLTLARILLARSGLLAAAVMLLAPPSVIVTGQLNQFDNLAIAIGALAALRLGRRTTGPVRREEWIGLALLGLSITTKHILFAFPLWLAVRQRTVKRALVHLLVPPAIFGASFLPWLTGGGADGTWDHVITYRSFDNAPLVHLLAPGGISDQHASRLASVVFVVALVAGAGLARRRDPLGALALYLLVTAVCAPAMANQYLAIPVFAVAMSANVAWIPWIIAATGFLLADRDGVDVGGVRRLLPDAMRTDRVGGRAYDLLVVALAAGAIATWWVRAQTSRKR